jgi:glycosyltransferase involved in cell wall biosynthesis
VKLVFVTQTLDPGHPALAQTVDLVETLAASIDEVAVACRDVKTVSLPANVTVRTFDARTKLGRGVAFERALVPLLRDADAVLVHMIPTFALLAAPFTRARRIPLLLWYTHWNASRSLRAAMHVCDVVLSVDRSSVPIDSPIVRGVGHAIDVDVFTADPPAAHDGPLRIFAFGRMARWKGYGTLLPAFSRAVAGGLDATLEIRGPSMTDDERLHRAELEAMVEADPILRPRVRLEPALSRPEIAELLRQIDVVVSAHEPRSGATLDKAVYEAAASARPVVTSNPALAPFLSGLPLPLLVPPRDIEALSASLLAVGNASVDVRAAVGAELRRRVVADHSLDHWAKAVIQVVREVRSGRVSVRSGRRPTA